MGPCHWDRNIQFPHIPRAVVVNAVGVIPDTALSNLMHDVSFSGIATLWTDAMLVYAQVVMYTCKCSDE